MRATRTTTSSGLNAPSLSACWHRGSGCHQTRLDKRTVERNGCIDADVPRPWDRAPPTGTTTIIIAAAARRAVDYSAQKHLRERKQLPLSGDIQNCHCLTRSPLRDALILRSPSLPNERRNRAHGGRRSQSRKARRFREQLECSDACVSAYRCSHQYSHCRSKFSL